LVNLCFSTAYSRVLTAKAVMAEFITSLTWILTTSKSPVV